MVFGLLDREFFKTAILGLSMEWLDLAANENLAPGSHYYELIGLIDLWIGSSS